MFLRNFSGASRRMAKASPTPYSGVGFCCNCKVFLFKKSQALEQNPMPKITKASCSGNQLAYGWILGRTRLACYCSSPAMKFNHFPSDIAPSRDRHTCWCRNALFVFEKIPHRLGGGESRWGLGCYTRGGSWHSNQVRGVNALATSALPKNTVANELLHKRFVFASLQCILCTYKRGKAVNVRYRRLVNQTNQCD